jgi:hypothetical protein
MHHFGLPGGQFTSIAAYGTTMVVLGLGLAGTMRTHRPEAVPTGVDPGNYDADSVGKDQS